MNNLLLYYDNIAEFKRKFSEKLLDVNHIIGGQIKFNSLHLPGESETDESFWGYEIEKDGIKYLFPSTDEDGRELKVRDIFPIIPKMLQKVAHKGIVYQKIEAYSSAKIRPVQHMKFKELVTSLTAFEVTNRDHYTLSIFNALTSYFLRYNHRVSSPAGFGKDSAVDLLGNLVGGCQSIVSPTYAKLEERAVILKWLAINEVVDIPKASWTIVQQYLLDFGAHRPSVVKHSKAHGIVGEEIDSSSFSLTLMYNDIDHYPDPKSFFDIVTKKQVRDRFPAFRFHGRFTEDFNQVNDLDIDAFVDKHYDKYKTILETIEYYRHHLFVNLHNYSKVKMPRYAQRIDLNLGRLLTIVDCYSESQEEFDKWIDVITGCIEDYKAMIKYPTMINQICSKMDIPKKDSENFKKMQYVIEHLRSVDPDEKFPATKHNIAYIEKINSADTYIKKQELVDNYKSLDKQQTTIEDKGGFW